MILSGLRQIVERLPKGHSLNHYIHIVVKIWSMEIKTSTLEKHNQHQKSCLNPTGTSTVRPRTAQEESLIRGPSKFFQCYSICEGSNTTCPPLNRRYFSYNIC